MDCLVSQRISSPSIPPLPPDDFSNRAIISMASDTVLLDSDGMRNKLKFDGVLRFSQNSTPEYMEVAKPAWRWRGSFFIIISLW